MDGYLNRRRIIKGRITRLEAIANNHTNIPLAAVAAALYKEKADAVTQELEAVQDNIMTTCKPEDFDVHEGEYHLLITRIETLVIFFTTLKNKTPVIQPTADIKLPKLELPVFGGSYVDWFPFHDLFATTVHNNTTLSGAQKFQYLKSSLRDEAAMLIQSIPVTNGNYEEAWDILLNRFNNTREMINAHIERLFNQPSVKDESSTALRRLIDTTAECIRSLKVLKEPVEHWDAILLHIVGEKLDQESRRQWELSLKGVTRPTYEELTTFLEQRARALAASQIGSLAGRSKTSIPPKKGTMSHHGSVRENSCVMCAELHNIYNCPLLLKATIEDRWNMIKKHALCFNCLRKNHSSGDCKAGSCRKCNARHNTLLHRESQEKYTSSRAKSNTEVMSHLSRQFLGVPQVILPTAIVQVEGISGHIWAGRALLDSGSQASFISEKFIQKLQLRRTYQNVNIGGIGSMGMGYSRGGTTLNIRSKMDLNVNIRIQALILNQVTEKLPNYPFNLGNWPHLKGLQLADPTCHIPGPIDILLGADAYLDVIQDGKLEGRVGTPGAFNTVFGWVMTGKLGSQVARPIVSQIRVNQCYLEQQLSKFWELEEIAAKRILTAMEKQCELIFQDTHHRDAHGKYIVKLPIKTNAPKLGMSRSIALRRFQYLERRLQTNPTLYENYRKFMNEYTSLNHMELVPADGIDEKDSYYLPHHAVFKEASTTTKVRVVFDASAKTSTGVSLNDVLLIGPKLQDDLVNLLIRFRSHAVAMTADIEKMYRQIKINPEDANYQRILWRSHKQDPIRDYRLLTVTYGTAAAPYLATKVLQQLAQDVRSEYPLASKALAEDFYMDDVLSGAEDITTALKLQEQLNHATRAGGFNLRKWASNEPALLESLPSELREISVPLKIENAEAIQTLGLQWTPATDHLSYTVKALRTRNIVTKRTILSDTAKVFDPLGLASPVTIRAKILLQEMWQTKISWDQELPSGLVNKWHVFREELIEIEDLKIQRYIGQPQHETSALYGFCDASQKAYAAVVYLKTTTNSGSISIQLIAAKTKVAPLKQTTLPRLELCATVLLVRLLTLIQESFKNNLPEVHCWSDSKIVLAWLASPPQRWKTFVANRVSEVQDAQPAIQWHHVSGECNPSDCASRGIDVKELRKHPLWWHGPSWLTNNFTYDQDSLNEEPAECSTEEKKALMVVSHCNTDKTPLSNYSSLNTLIHVTAYVQRFIRNTRTTKILRETGSLTKQENDLSLNHWIRITQLEYFTEEVRNLKAQKPITSKSKLLSLTPFLDKNDILRVGGRIRHSKLPIDQMHPVILPRKSNLTDLIIQHEHRKTLHGGPQLMMVSLQSRYWIFGSREAIRFHVRRCIRCVRQKAATINQLMGDLPASRVTPARAFLRCGVDYAGPFNLKVMKGRGCKSFKGYISVFACFTTRALHLELVSDLSADAFLAALKRFVARRGKCVDMHSDCGTNFIGANREMKDFLKTIASNTRNPTIARWMSDEGINWKFNPPSAPHFGGLWEAGVKSVKYHLKRVIGETKLTYEEMQTLLCQIEACLNSRPLTPMTSDPTDFSALTPGHFLIGDALIAIPEPDLTTIKVNRLSRWQLSQQLLQHFWRRWQAEYLSRLQQRPKWTKPRENIKVGDLVLLKEELPPTKWKMARVTQVHPGEDELVRVVTVKTADNELKRPVVKLCLLPLDS